MIIAMTNQYIVHAVIAHDERDTNDNIAFDTCDIIDSFINDRSKIITCAMRHDNVVSFVIDTNYKIDQKIIDELYNMSIIID